MSKEQIYLKVFSPILGLQEEERVEYCLVEQNNGKANVYGIEVKSINSKNETSQMVEYLSENKEKVLNFIKYLYENSVKTDACKDIIDDFSGRKRYYI